MPFPASLALAALVAAGPAPADLVLTNAVVHTVDAKRPRAEAVAVRGNRIAAVGSLAEVRAFVASVRNNEPCIVDGRDGVAALELAEAILADIDRRELPP